MEDICAVITRNDLVLTGIRIAAEIETEVAIETATETAIETKALIATEIAAENRDVIRIRDVDGIVTATEITAGEGLSPLLQSGHRDSKLQVVDRTRLRKSGLWI